MAIVLRSEKGSPLTHGEVDANFIDASERVRVNVRNDSSATLTVGTVVKATGYHLGQDRINVAPVTSLSDVAFGVIDEEIIHHDNGTIINTGVVEGVDTSSFAVGDKLYSNGLGSFTSTIQPAPFQTCGFVLRSNANNGRLYVEFSNQEGLSYDDLGNVTITGSCSATSFLGDGSTLSGINTDLVNDTTPQLGGNLNLNSNDIVGTGDINITGFAAFNGNCTALTYYGDGSNLTNLPAGGISNVVEDTTPQLGGDLSLNSSDITGTGNINITGSITSSANASINGVEVGGSRTGTMNLGDSSTVFGYNALLPTSGMQVGQTAIGANTLKYATGFNNTAVGNAALESNSTGGSNVAVGAIALNDNTSGSGNVAIGAFSGTSNTTASLNTFIGSDAGRYGTTGDSNTAIGNEALRSATTPSWNTGVGFKALRGVSTGHSNTALGSGAAIQLTTGIQNTVIGKDAGRLSTTGDGNVMTGYYSGYANTTGANNTFLGTWAGYTTVTGDENTSIGYAAASSSSSVSNEFTLGSTNVANLRCNDTTISSLSDIRDKTNIEDIPLGLDFVNKMRPVSFDWNRRDGSFKGRKEFGFIAQELKEIQDETDYSEHLRLVHEDNPDKLEADPMKTYPVLVKAIQEMAAKIAILENKINELEQGA
jgi:hypothetical protein